MHTLYLGDTNSLQKITNCNIDRTLYNISQTRHLQIFCRPVPVYKPQSVLTYKE